MKNILVVGGAGYLGGAVTDLLANCSEYNFKVYDSLLYEDYFRKPVKFIHGDVRDREKLKPLLDWSDTVIWLAALVGDAACALQPDLTVAVNEKSVEWLTQNYKGRIIFMSTCSVYGRQAEVVDEQSPVAPLSLYAGTKLKAEGYLTNSDAAIFRLGTLFGVGDNFSRIRMDLMVNLLTAKACLQKKIVVFGGKQYRPLAHVKDVALAILRAVENDFTGIFNIHGENMSVLEFAELLKTYVPDVAVETTEARFQDERDYRVSSAKAAAVFGFKPQYMVASGIQEICELIGSKRVANVFHSRHSNSEHLKKVLEIVGTN